MTLPPWLRWASTRVLYRRTGSTRPRASGHPLSALDLHSPVHVCLHKTTPAEVIVGDMLGHRRGDSQISHVRTHPSKHRPHLFDLSKQRPHLFYPSVHGVHLSNQFIYGENDPLDKHGTFRTHVYTYGFTFLQIFL